MNVFEGKLKADGGEFTFAIIVSRFNSFIGERLLEGCTDKLVRSGVNESALTVIRVPGSFEIPLAAQKVAQTGKYSAVICLGAVIRGQTPHFDFVANEVAKGVSQVSLKTGVPCIFGVITSDTIEQAIERAGTKAGNKGADAAETALEMVNLFKQF